MEAQNLINEYIKRARDAQAIFEKKSQEEVDKAVKVIARVIVDNAVMLAEFAVNETGMGNVTDKISKHTNKPKLILNHLIGKKSRGILERDETTGITLVAKPMGVVGAITPTTNPVVTSMSNSMFSLKCGNSIILAPHPRAKGCSDMAAELMRGELKKIGLPEDLIQVLPEPSLEVTTALMKAVDVVIATGGMGMVKAVYSSGKPALGVGTGNVQTILDRNIDYAEAIPKIIEGRVFDNGILCTADQSVMCPKEKYDEIMELFSANKALVVKDADMIEKFRKALFDENGILSRHVVGQSAQKIGVLAGVNVPDDIRIIVLEASGFGMKDVLAKEKMCPCISAYKYDKFEDAVEIARANLEREGKGHSVSIHSNDTQHIEYVAEELSVSRFVVNQVCAIAGAGSYNNNLAPTNTLGCGSWGNNSISENLDYKHLMNVSRIAYFVKDAHIPSDKEVWG
ncbi:MAG: aldehyde dehydrogenase family protein [Eubacteriales bacterium]|nr:aldehyde dehydrogenase family protein [Eubacteriales bacterium]